MKTREYRESDCGEIAELFYNTVHSVNARDYTEEQLNVWATGTVDLEAWNESFHRHHTIVAEDESGITGFGDLDGGYLDRLYVRADRQGRGIASAITALLEARAAEMGEMKITTHASLTARGFFEKRGYTTVRAQSVVRKGVSLTNIVMEKPL